jgi:hypothetical protein
VVNDDLRVELGQERACAGSGAGDPPTATDASGGCVMHDVATSRGAPACFHDCHTADRPRRGASAKTMCGSIRWPTAPGTGPAARRRRGRVVAGDPMAVKHESQPHWCGYKLTDGQV